MAALHVTETAVPMAEESPEDLLVESGSAEHGRLKGWVYKPAIDGLRALAVMSVLLYHGRVGWAQGGFLGVDLFFALSGYLITALLVVEHRDTGGINVTAFWTRRAKRLLPALMVVMVAVAVYVALAATPEEAGRLRADGLATLAYSANWWYALSGASYFEAFKPSMFRHTWSLGIEEQFYLVWPVLFTLGYRWFRGRSHYLAAVVAVGGLVSAALMFALYQPGQDPSRVFYGTDTRLQAILLGAALALILHSTIPLRISERWREVIGAAGLFVVVVMMVTVSDRAGWMYRGGFLLVAVAAVCAIAGATGRPDTVVNRALAWSPLIWIGGISYGLYLYHWPIFVFLDEERTGLHGYALMGLRLGLTFGIAALSYTFIEMPFRHSHFRGKAVLAMSVGAAAISVALFFGSTTIVNNAPTPLASSKPADPNAPRVLVNGDSSAYSLATGYDGAGGLNVATAAILGCGVVRGQNNPIDRPPFGTGAACDTWPDKWTAKAASFQPQLTVVGLGAWEVFDKVVDGKLLKVGSPAWERYVTSELETSRKIASPNGEPYVILNAPCFKSINSISGKPNPERNDPERVAAVNKVLADFAAKHAKTVHLIDLHGFLCPDGTYVDEIAGTKMREDGVHYTREGAAVIWNWLAPQLQPFLHAKAN